MNRGLALLKFLVIGLFLLVPTCRACSVPVFRYALERWPSDVFEAVVLHPGPLTSPDKEAVEALDQFAQKNPVNLSVQILDTSKPLPPAYENLGEQIHKAEVGRAILVLRYPIRFGRADTIYSGHLASAVLQSMMQSPARRELVRRIGSGHTAVFLILANNDAEKTAALKKLADEQSSRLDAKVKIPALSPKDLESQLQSTIPFKIMFSTLVVNQNDPAERVFVDMLLTGVRLQPGQNVEPLLIPVFGQGRILDVWPSSNVNEETFDEIATFLCGPCLCKYKEQNEGRDLLLTADWNRILLGQETIETPGPNFSVLLEDTSKSETAMPKPAPKPAETPIERLPTVAHSPEISYRNVVGLMLMALGGIILFVRLGLKSKVLLGSGMVVLGAIFLLPGRRPAHPENEVGSNSSKSLMMYCAAGLRDPIEKVRKEYEQKYGIEVQVQYGGSGTLLNNLSIAQKGDLYLSADANLLIKAHENGWVIETFPLATQRPVVITARGNPLKINQLANVTRTDVKWCFANPETAAVGTVTRRVLQKLGIWDTASRQANVFKPTVNDIANDVKLGSVDAGIVWNTAATAYPELETLHFPELDNDVEEVKVGVLSFSKQPGNALHFARFLAASDRGLLQFKHLGYEISDGDEWSENPELIIYSGALNRLSLSPVIDDFEKREGVTVKAIYNGCGILTAQMKVDSGKKSFPDLYFACDSAFLEPVQKWYLPATVVSETDIVMLVAKGNPKEIHGASDLQRAGLKLGIGNCEQCTLGLLTKRFLTAAEGMYEQIKPNVRSEQPTADILVNQMLTGSLDAIIVYKVNADQVKDKLDIIPITEKGAVAVQPIAISKASVQKYLARRLINRLLSPVSRENFESLGFRWRSGEPAL